jgi:hypothetical protein
MIARRVLLHLTAFIALTTAVVLGAHQLLAPKEPGLAGMMPNGALLYIESPDFQSLLSDWSNSPEKQAWLKSDNYAVFSQSRLFGRLSQAQSEFTTAAGLPPDMQFLAQVAGKQSALAWYDIGNLEFLYITRLPSANFSQSALWQSRGKFQQRQSCKMDFYVRDDPQSRRTVSFAAVDDWVILGTREDLVANALALMSGTQAQTLRNESWFADSLAAAKAPGDLRMVLNLEKIVPSPYFRSYWIQQNITAMKQYRAAISDLYRSKDTYREERVLLRAGNASEDATGGDISALAASVPVNTGFYKAVANPSPQQTVDILKDKLLDPRPGVVESNRYAPTVTLTDQTAGQASDLETRIDQAPAAPKHVDSWEPLRSLLTRAQVNGLLELESSATQADGVFTQFHSAIVLSAAEEWNIEQLKPILSSELEPPLTTSQLGLAWTERPGYTGSNGLLPLLLSVRGKYLILANDPSVLLAVQKNLNEKRASADPSVYASSFNHAQESGNFRRISTLVDRANMRGNASNSEDSADTGEPGQAPSLFSGNLVSLSRVFSGVQSESLVVRNAGNNVTQTVTYQWR